MAKRLRSQFNARPQHRRGWTSFFGHLQAEKDDRATNNALEYIPLLEIPVNLIKRLAYKNGFTVARQIPTAQQAALFSSLWPVETGIGLIRFGGSSDGGYLVPDDLEGIHACFSPGVEQTALFEEEMIKRNIPCYLADASVDGPPFEHPLIDFEKKFLASYDGENLITIDKWVESKVSNEPRDLVLQIDIEGDEWGVLLNMSDELLKRFRIIVIELHGMERVFDPFGYRIIQTALSKLLRWFNVVHLHPNNSLPVIGNGEYSMPCVLEMTLLRKDRGKASDYVRRFPNPLDVDCEPMHPTDTLPPSLYAGTSDRYPG